MKTIIAALIAVSTLAAAAVPTVAAAHPHRHKVCHFHHHHRVCHWG